ncbi:MAG TPA: YiaA/YiaB family inner membrane protein [Nocardioidaceae bacterium]|nr:YiaA/YiaB family inner membrane protein [Nocardioidaceae bacterium]
MSNATAPKNTTAFYVQSMIAFGLALTAVTFGIWYLPVDAWIRAFLIVASLFMVSSTFTLAKCVRDAQESTTVLERLDQKLLAEREWYPPTS